MIFLFLNPLTLKEKKFTKKTYWRKPPQKNTIVEKKQNSSFKKKANGEKLEHCKKIFLKTWKLSEIDNFTKSSVAESWTPTKLGINKEKTVRKKWEKLKETLGIKKSEKKK